jgi:hypothetical protein
MLEDKSDSQLNMKEQSKCVNKISYSVTNSSISYSRQYLLYMPDSNNSEVSKISSLLLFQNII